MNSKIAYLLALLPLTSSLIQAQVFPEATTSISESVPYANSATNFYGVRSSMKINPVTGHPGIAHFDRTAGHLIYTESDGTDWTESVVDTFSTSNGRNPDHFYCSLAFDAAGKPNIAFFDRDEARLKFSRRNAAGTGWITEAVDDVIYYGDAGRFCSLGYAPNGKFYVSYYHYSVDYLDQNNPDDITVYTADLRVATRSVSGTWSIETVDSVGDVGQSCALDIAPTGYPAVSYLDISNNDLKGAYFNGTVWSKFQITKASSFTAIDTRLESDGDIEIAVVYRDPLSTNLETVFASVRSSGSYIGAYRTTIDSSTSFADPSITFDGAGKAIVSYHDVFNNRLRLSSRGRSSYVETSNTLGSWSSVAIGLDGMASVCSTSSGGKLNYKKLTGWSTQTIDSDGFVGLTTSHSYGPGGQPAISYWDFTIGSLIFSERNSNGAWARNDIDNFNNVGYGSSLTYSPQGRPCISYFDSDEGDLKFAERDASGLWSTQVISSDGNVGIWSSLSYGSEGQPAIAYLDRTNYDLKFGERVSTGNWTIQTVDSVGNTGSNPSLRYGPEGRPSICYIDNSNATLKFAGRGTNGTWNTQVIDNSMVAADDSSLSFKFNPEGRPAVSYYGNNCSRLKFAEYKADGIWITQTIDNTGNVGDCPSLAYGPEGRPTISYSDNSTEDLKFAERGADGNWFKQTIDSYGKVGLFSSLRYNLQGDATISYFDKTNRDLKFAERIISPNGLMKPIPLQVAGFTRDPTTKAAMLSWQGTAAAKYDVEFSTSLAAGSWQPIGTDINALDGMTFFRTTPALGQANPRAFFRVKKK